MPVDQRVFGLFFRVCQGKLKNKIVSCRDISTVVLARNIAEACRKFNVEIIGDPVGCVRVKLPSDPPPWFRRGIAEAMRQKMWQERWFELKTVWHVEQLPMIYD